MIKKNFHINSIGIILLIVVLVIQTTALVHMGFEKRGLHIDEVYSYILSNSHDSAKIIYENQVWNKWLSGDDFKKFVTVEKGEQFSYGKVYYNNTLDAHPPLFYFLLHTVCSLFPGEYSLWFGLVLNIVIILATQIVIFLFAKEVTGSHMWGIVPVAFYGATMAFFDTTVFIRMYPLLTLFTVLLAWKHYHIIKNPEKRSAIVWCFAITFLGVFTQYYFAIVAFFMAVAMCVRMLCRRDWKTVLIYAGAMLSAVACVFVVYPAGITQITGSETNNVGVEVMGNLFNLAGWMAAVRSMFKQAYNIITPGFSGKAVLGISILFVAAALSLVFREKDTSPKQSPAARITEAVPTAVLFVVLFATVILIAHVSSDFVYVRYIYNLFPLFAFGVGTTLFMIVKAVKINKNIVAIGIIVVCLMGTVNIARNDSCSYLFVERTVNDRQIIETYQDKPLIMLNDGSNHQPTGLLNFIFEAQQVYLADYTDFAEDTNEILSQVDCNKGVVVIVLTDRYWSSGFDGDEVMEEIVAESVELDSYKLLGYCDFSTAYVAYPAASG